MSLQNIDVRMAVSDSGLTYKEIAEKMGIHRCSLSRLMRTPLNPKDKARIMSAIKGKDDVKIALYREAEKHKAAIAKIEKRIARIEEEAE